MIKFPQTSVASIVMKGGLDTETPTLQLNDGAIIDGVNYEANAQGGYSRCGGLERFDGQLKPSDATYSIVQVSSFTNTPVAGQTLTGFPSGATGTIISVGTSHVVITEKTGAYTIGETVKVGTTVIGVVATTTVSVTIQENAQLFNLAADVYRAHITAPPGSGAVLGGSIVNDVHYVFKNNAGGTAVDLWKSSNTGWQQVAFEYEVSFSNANTSVNDSDELTHTASGKKATIRRVMVETGTLASGTNTGRLIISAQTGTMTPAGACTTTGGGTLATTNLPTAITMLPGGKYQIVKGNFIGQAGQERLYGCDGINPMFEFDGLYYCPIRTLLSPDAPKYIIIHKNHLFYAAATTLYNSGVGAPYNQTTTAGAAYNDLSDTITGLVVQPGSQTTATMSVLCKQSTHTLYGTSSANWQLASFASGVGAMPYSAQVAQQAYFVDGRGVTTLTASQVYGNFESATLTDRVKRLITSKRMNINCSSISRERSQYRLFFSDGYALYCTVVNGKYLGATSMNLGKIAYNSCSSQMNDGTEVLFIYATDGYVYQLDKGSSFDGENIGAYLTLNTCYAKSPMLIKSWRQCRLDIKGDNYAQISLGCKIESDTDESSTQNTQTFDSNMSSIWNFDTPGIYFDTPGLYFDGKGLSPEKLQLEGDGEGIQITISSGTDYIKPYTISSMMMQYIPRRLTR